MGGNSTSVIEFYFEEYLRNEMKPFSIKNLEDYVVQNYGVTRNKKLNNRLYALVNRHVKTGILHKRTEGKPVLYCIHDGAEVQPDAEPHDESPLIS